MWYIKTRKITPIVKAIGLGFILYSVLIALVYNILFKLNTTYYITAPGTRAGVYTLSDAFTYIPHRPLVITSIPFYIAFSITGLIAGAFWKRESTSSASRYETIGGGAVVGCCIAIFQTIAGFMVWSYQLDPPEGIGLLLYAVIMQFIFTTPVQWWSFHVHQGWPFPTIGLLLFFLLPTISAALGAWAWSYYFAE
jgi:hypothetical protein